MMQPCEIIVLSILPSLRSQLAKQLVDIGLSQQEVSEVLDITPAAVSQYVSGKRGHEIEFNSEIKTDIRGKAKEISENQETQPTNLICSVCQKIKKTDAFCDLLEKHGSGRRNCEDCKFEPVCVC